MSTTVMAFTVFWVYCLPWKATGCVTGVWRSHREHERAYFLWPCTWQSPFFGSHFFLSSPFSFSFFFPFTPLLLPLFSWPTPECPTFSSFLFPSPSSQPQICFSLSTVVCSLSESGDEKLKQTHSLWQSLSPSGTMSHSLPVLSALLLHPVLILTACSTHYWCPDNRTVHSLSPSPILT